MLPILISSEQQEPAKDSLSLQQLLHLPTGEELAQHKAYLEKFSFQNMVVKPDLSQLVQRRIISHHHELKPQKSLLLPIEKSNTDNWIALFLLIGFLLLAILRVLHRKRLNQLFRAFFIPHYFNQVKRDGDLLEERITILLSPLYLISISLFWFVINTSITKIYLPVDIPNLLFYFLIFFSVLTFSLVKFLLIHFIGNLFTMTEEAYHHSLINFSVNYISGILFLPLVTILLFSQSSILLYSSLVIFLIIHLYRIIILIISSFSNSRFSPFYNFLYLCTLEILPYLILLKFLV